MRIIERDLTEAEMVAGACETCGNCSSNSESCSEKCCESIVPAGASKTLTSINQIAAG